MPKIHRTRSLKSTITNTIKKLNLKNPYDVDKIVVNIDYLIKIPELQIRRTEEPAMGQGVEVRFPYLNEELKSLVNSIRLEEKIDKNLVEKILLRKIAKKLVPKKLQSDKDFFSSEQYISSRVKDIMVAITPEPEIIEMNNE